MKNSRLFLATTLMFVSSSTFANLAQVVKIRGASTYLAGGMLEAKPVVLNQWLSKDTSILTTDKAFLVIKYKNGSGVTLGPNSKIVIDSGLKDNQQVVNLLVGKFKASVKNLNHTNENKMIIKTTTAALGIRGTEFQTSYNPLTKITSLLTFEGSVAMVKLDQHQVNRPIQNVENIESMLKTDSVLVKMGEYSGISEGQESITAPVKISPDQFTKLKLIETLGAEEETISKEVFQKELSLNEKLYASTKTLKDDVLAKDVQVMRPGGFVDLKTGIYLPPTSDSTFDKKMEVFLPSEKIGKVDAVGNYQAPFGLSLDPAKGFVPDQSATVTSEATHAANELNAAILKQVAPVAVPVIKKKKSLDNIEEDVYKKYYDPKI